MSSKYKDKRKGRDNKPVPKKKPLGEPVFIYTSVCHGVRANKKPCIVDVATQFSDRNKAEHSLGSWNCTFCRKKCSVTRKKNEEDRNDRQEIRQVDCVEPDSRMAEALL
jgi:hypothetical protein